MDRLLRVLALLRDPRTPALPRLAVLLAVVYLLSPVDLIPGSVLPVVGWLDDLTFVWLALRWLVRSAPPPGANVHRPPTLSLPTEGEGNAAARTAPSLPDPPVRS